MRGRREKELVSHSPAENELGTAIRAWRRFRGLSVTELAIAAGFGINGRGYISRIEHSQIRHLGEERLNRIAAALELQSADLLLHRMPEAPDDAPTRDLDDAIIGGKALLKKCTEQSFDWARIQLLLAKLYRERAAASRLLLAKYTAFTEAQHCIECALLVFTASAAPQSFQEATQLGREIGEILEITLITGSLALLKRCPPQSLDWARIHVLLAKCYRERTTALEGQAARTALTEAQRCIKAALSVFTQKRAQRNAKEATQLQKEIVHAIEQLDER